MEEYQVSVKVDPAEVNKISVNIAEQIITAPVETQPDPVITPATPTEERDVMEEREGVISPDESYRSLATICDEEEIKILEENLIQSPTEEVADRPHTGVVYPGQVIEVTYVDESEQQTEPIDAEKKVEVKPAVCVDIKEVQVSAEVAEQETQMSPRVESPVDLQPQPAVETSDNSMQTIIQEFIETESQTIQEQVIEPTEKIPQEEQQTQTDTIEEMPQVDHVEKLEMSMQTLTIETQEEISQTEITPDVFDSSAEAREASEVIVTEIILKAMQPVSPKRSPPPIQREVSVEEIAVDPKIVETIQEIPQEPEKKSKKAKKVKKQKSKDSKVELQIDTTVQEPERTEKSQVKMSFTPDNVNVDVEVAISQPTTSAAPETEVINRLNKIMALETKEQQQAAVDSFALSQNLNNLINNVELKGSDVYPWDDVNYMLNANIENRYASTDDYLVAEPDENADLAVNDGLQKVEQYVNILPEIVNSGNDRMTQRTVIIITKVIVTCLENIERRIYFTRQNRTRDENSGRDLDNLDDSLAKLRENIQPMQNPELKQNIEKCIISLQQHVQLDKTNQNSADNDIKNYQFELKKSDDAVQGLVQQTTSIESKLDEIMQNDEIPFDDKLNVLENIDVDCKDNKKLACRLIKLDNLSDNQVNDIRACFDRTKNAEHNAWKEKRKLMQIMNLSEEYVQTLDEFSQIILIADALVDENVVANSLEQLHNEIQRHRKFFVHVNQCRNILESLEKNLDPETKVKHNELHRSLHQKAVKILEKAGVRSQNLSLAAVTWNNLERRMQSEIQWLQLAQNRIPDISSVTSCDYENYISLYQSIYADLIKHQSQQMQNIEMAITLQKSVNSQSSIVRCNDSLTKLVKMREDVKSYVDRLSTFRKFWNEFSNEADKIEIWLNYIETELNRIDIPKHFGEYPVESLRNFWEIKAQYEYYCQVRSAVSNNFDKSLRVLSIADESVQRQFFGQLEERWMTVTNKIEGIKKQIIENFSSPADTYDDKLSFLERELDELVFSIDNMKGIIRNPDELNMYIERLIVLKSRIVVVENELVTIGFVSANETERVGELCEKSHKVSNAIDEEMELADLCKGRLNTLRQEIGNIRESQVGFYDKLSQLDSAAKLESASIEKAIFDCQLLRNDLVSHWQEIMRARHLLHTLPTGLRMSVSPVDVEKEISQLEDDYVDIEKRLFGVENLLKTRLQLWKRFERQLEAIQQSIEETDFMVELLTVHGNIDYDRLQKATEKLEGLYSDFDSHENAIQDLKDYAQPLMEFCDEQVSQDIENSMQKAVARWNETNDSLKQICDRYKKAVTSWRKYCDESDVIRNVINEHFGGVDNFLGDLSLDDIEVSLLPC